MRIRLLGGVAVAACVVMVAACTAAPQASPSASVAAATPILTPAVTRPPAASTAAPLYDKQADARADIAAALKAARADGKRVLIDFGADWCPDCHVLSAYMDGPAGRSLIEPHFHVVCVDVGMWDHNVDVAAEYGNAISVGIPAVVVLDKNGKIIGSTADGSLASAAGMSEAQVLAILAGFTR
jgi:thiol:disulfide interchange protein